MAIDWEHTEKELTKFGDKVVRSARKNLNQKGKLNDSIEYKKKIMPRSWSFFILMAEYGKFQDQGVKGHGRGTWRPKRPKRQQAPRSKYKFKTGPGSKLIRKQIVEKPKFRTRDLETGRFTPKNEKNKQQAAFLIARSMGRFGIPAKRFMQKAITSHEKTFIKNLGKAWVSDNKKFARSLKKQYQ